jgi:hypothetical protein
VVRISADSAVARSAVHKTSPFKCDQRSQCPPARSSGSTKREASAS